jgi:hypothetical protein
MPGQQEGAIDAQLGKLERQRVAGEITEIGYHLQRNRLLIQEEQQARGAVAGQPVASSSSPYAAPSSRQPPPFPQPYPVGQLPYAPRPYTAVVSTPGGSHPRKFTPGWSVGAEVATFWRRAGAYLIDGAVVSVCLMMGWWALVVSVLSYVRNPGVGTPANRTNFVDNDLVWVARLVLTLLAAFFAGYFGVLVSRRGRTLGQSALSLWVVRQEDTDQRLSAGRALLRAVLWWGPFVLLQLVLLQIVSISLFNLLGTLWSILGVLAVIGVASDPLKQGWHDKLGGALVIEVRAAPTLVIAERM